MTGCIGVKDEKKDSGLKIEDLSIDLPDTEREFKIIFIADTHISLCDERDGGIADFVSQRYELFRDETGRGADETFKELIAYVIEEDPDLLILGGDILDTATLKGVEFVGQELSKISCPYIYSLGNHDFTYEEEYYTPKAFSEYLPRIEEIVTTRDGYQIYDAGIMYILALDDYNNRYSEGSLEALKEVEDKGKPVLVITHVPIEPETGDRSLLNDTIEMWGISESGGSRVLLGPTSQTSDENTREIIAELLSDNSPVVHVLAGHIHLKHSDSLNGKINQTVTGAGFMGEAVRLLIK